MNGRNFSQDDLQASQTFDGQNEISLQLLHNNHRLPESNPTTHEPDNFDTELEINEDTYYQRKPRIGRSTSKIFIDTETGGTPIKCVPISKLGKGAFASVRKFGNKDVAFAVKKPKRTNIFCANDEAKTKLMFEAVYELYFLKKAYPHEGPYSLYRFDENNPDEKDTLPLVHDWRIIMPLIEGQNFLQFLENIGDHDILAVVIYNIAAELQRIHELNIIHGDVSLRNIMILPDFSVHFIDFDFAYDAKGNATTINLEKNTPCYFAPERINTTNCKAHPAQDVYSLAQALKAAVHFNGRTLDKLKFQRKYNCILDFIAKANQTSPEARPELKCLIEDLEHLIFIPRLKVALLNNNKPALTTLLNNFVRRYPEREIHRVLYTLCDTGEYDAAGTLIDYLQSSIVNGYQNAALELFNFMVEVGKKIPKIHHGIYQSKSRTDTLQCLITAYKLADAMIEHKDEACSTTLLNDLEQTPILKMIYDELCAQHYISPDKLSLSCTIL